MTEPKKHAAATLVQPTALPGLILITPHRFIDHRGFFVETYSCRLHEWHGIHIEFLQDNHSFSAAQNTLRGLHFQAPPHAQDKLVRCLRGSMLDVAVDIRRGSPTYGQWLAEELSAENGKQLLVPKGFLHGFLTLQPETEVEYKCSAYYAPDSEGAVRWDSVGIDWGLSGPPVLSPKDAQAGPFCDFVSPFTYQGSS